MPALPPELESAAELSAPADEVPAADVPAVPALAAVPELPPGEVSGHAGSALHAATTTVRLSPKSCK